MKKIIIFLITIIGFQTLLSYQGKAIGEFSFYEGEYIPGIFMVKEKNGTKYYQKARYFRLSGNNLYAYCIEPFAMFNENSKYQGSLTADNLSKEQMRRISLISYFGYGYGTHTTDKWYAITQFMIWKESDPSGNMYFTDTLNGNKIEAYQAEMQEINNLIQNYLTLPSITNQEISLVEDHSITLTDTNHVLSNYITNHPNVSILGNNLMINNLKEGTYQITLTRKNKRTSRIPLFYNSKDSQNMSTTGDLEDITVTLKIHVKKTTIEITKIDKDTQTTTPSGEGSLNGAIYQIYDEKMKEVTTLTIGKDMKSKFENLNFGKYYIKEIKAGAGYKLDENIYEFLVDKDHLDIKLTLENEIIKKKVEINKDYGDGVNTKKESGIHFDIYDYKNELYDTIVTNDQGYACIYLPYGKYLIKQRNSTKGYAKIESFIVDATNEEPLKYNFYDYKIKVPNTSKNTNHLFSIILILGGFYAKKRIFN